MSEGQPPTSHRAQSLLPIHPRSIQQRSALLECMHSWGRAERGSLVRSCLMPRLHPSHVTIRRRNGNAQSMSLERGPHCQPSKAGGRGGVKSSFVDDYVCILWWWRLRDTEFYGYELIFLPTIPLNISP